MHKVSSTAISTGTVATSGSLPPPSSSVDSTQLTTDTGTVADLPPSSSLDHSIQLATVASLSVEISSIANDVLVPLHCLQGIWKKAEELLATPGSITAAPGSSEEARMVLSHSGQQPHLVVQCKGRKFKCDSDCANYKSMGICSHSLAVAEINKQLPVFLESFKKAKKRPNFTQLALHNMPAGRGRKGSLAPWKRKANVTPTVYTSRISDESVAQGSSTKQSVIGIPGSTVNISVLPTTPPVSSTSPPPACNSSDHHSYPAYDYSDSPWMSHYPQLVLP